MNTLTRKILDHAAISMAVLCGIHCLVTPVLLVALPIIATTFWVHENFHLWMLLFVIPTTSLAVWSGCRRHKDKWVVVSAVVGIGILVTALVAERIEHAHGPDGVHLSTVEGDHHSIDEPVAGPVTDDADHAGGGGCCELHPSEGGALAKSETGGGEHPRLLTWHALLNTLGGCFLVFGHGRNFLLCCKDKCSHGEACCASN